MRGFLGALALAALAGAALAAPSTTDFVNAKVQRRVDVSRHVVRATTTIELRGGASAGKSKYFLALPSDEAAQLAFLRVKDQADRELPVSRAPDSDQCVRPEAASPSPLALARARPRYARPALSALARSPRARPSAVAARPTCVLLPR